MSKLKVPGRTTKKHQARAERERKQRNWILGGAFTTFSLVIGLLGYGWYYTAIIQPRQPISIVNRKTITTLAFQNRVRLSQRNLLLQRERTIEMLNLFFGEVEFQQNFQQQLTQIDQLLDNPSLLGGDVLYTLVDEVLIREEADRREIFITADDVDQAVNEFFNYYPNGTPTPLPTITPAPTNTPGPTELAAEVEPPMTPTEGPSPTASPTGSPLPSPTPYTAEAFLERYQAYLGGSSGFESLEQTFRGLIEASLYREKLLESFEGEVEREQEQTHLRQILLEELEAAEEVMERIDSGDVWEEIAAELSLDTSTKDFGGDLGWFTYESLIARFDVVALPALSAPLEEIIGPLQTEDGWHLFQVLEHEVRPLSDNNFQQAVEIAFNTWLGSLRDSSEIETDEDWIDRVPSAPSEVR